MKSLGRLKEDVFSWNGLMLGLFTVLIGIFLIWMPKYLDDYWFMAHYGDWFASQGVQDASEGGNIFIAGIPWDKVVDTWLEHIYIDSNRLGNIFVAFFLLFPKWVGSLLVVISWVYSMACSLRLARVNFNKSALVALSIILWGAFVPWTDRMGCEAFQFNYFFPTAMSLWLLSLLGFGRRMESDSLPNTRNLVGLFIVACLTGWWHEGFSIPLFCGLSVLVVLNKECRTREYTIALVGLFIGILIIFCTLGTRSRLNDSVSLSWSYLKSQLPYILSYNVAYFSLIALVVWGALRSGWREEFKDKTITLALVSGIIPLLISVVIYAQARVTFWTQIISIIAILKLLGRQWNGYWSRYRLSNSLWLIPLVLLTFVHFAVSDYYVFRMRAAQSNSIKAYFANPDKTVFADVILPGDQPLICLRMPDVLFYSTDCWRLSEFVQRQTGKRDFAMIPRELRYVDSKSGKPLEGGASARIYGNRVFMSYDLFQKQMGGSKILEIDYGSGYEPVPYWGYEFESDRDGEKYVYVFLFNSCYSQHFRTVKRLRFID